MLGDGCEVVGEHASKGGDVFEFGREAGADNVVGGCHAFHDVCWSGLSVGWREGWVSLGDVPPLM